jgi:phenylacetate-CoA ligase
VGVRVAPGLSLAIRTILEDIEGHLEDVLRLPGKAGNVNVYPIVFHQVLDQAATAGWQVIQEASGLRVPMAGLAPGASAEGVRAAVERALTTAGVSPLRVDLHVVEHTLNEPLWGNHPSCEGWRVGDDKSVLPKGNPGRDIPRGIE